MSSADESPGCVEEYIVESLGESSGYSWARGMADNWLTEHREEVALQVSLLPENVSREEILATILRGYAQA